MIASSLFESTAAKPPQKRKENRDPFRDYQSPLLPPSKCLWSAALQKVDRSTSNIVRGAQEHPEFKCYALPDPHLMVTPQDDTKKTAYLLTWLRARPSLLYQLQQQRCLTQKLQFWREFLELLGRNSGRNDSSHAARIRKSIVDMFGPTFT